ncbi:MAG: T9SS type A sorting domain-containing protein [Ignavibacteria bacterium]|nr:T9SS type A sorting domain-containing protein [Ignavibacteria bacterium]
MKKITGFIVLSLILTVNFMAQQGNIKGIANENDLNNTEIQSITGELSKARLCNNAEGEKLYLSKLKSFYGETKTEGKPDVVVIPGNMTGDNTILHGNSTSQFNSFLDGPNVKTIATQTSSRSNTLFAATTKFFDSNYDIIRVFASYDNGVSWVLKGYSYLSARFRTGELDIEPIIGGADTVLFCAAGYTVGTHIASAFFSFNFSTSAQNFNFWYHWGSASSNVNVYNPRITSDNSVYAGAFVYVSVSVDSLRSDGIKNVYQRFAMVFNPLNNLFQITYRNNQSFYWYGSTPNGANYYIWQDLCFYRSQKGTDRVYTIFNIPAYSYLYSAYSDNYGLSPAGNSTYSDGIKIDEPHVVSSGGLSNQNIAIAYRVLTSNSNNYDFKCLYSSNGGTSFANFNTTYIEGSNQVSCKYIDVQAIKLSQGKCKFTYSTYNDLNIYYTGNINNTSYEPTISLLADPLYPVSSYGKLRAGYTGNAFAAGCMVLYNSEFSNQTLCVTDFCIQENISIGDPKSGDVHLENYPNPFNPTTTIKYSVPVESKVKITVYDLLGKEISVLVNENHKAGKYDINFDASSLSSGTYFYKIEAGSFSDIKKMILLK